MSPRGPDAGGLRAELLVERRPRAGEPFRLEAAFETGRGVTVVFGPSGAGKSTLLLAILGGIGSSSRRPRRAGPAETAPAAVLRGRICLDGQALLDTDTGVDRPVHDRRLGIVFQDALLFPHMDARRNVEFAVRAEDGARVRGGAGRRCALETLERVGAADVADRMPSELSGGQRQRVALARALAARPRALLLDEPFSSLDAPSREALGSMLLTLQSETGIPFVHVTHDLAEAIRLGTAMLVLDGGRVVQSGPPERIVAAPVAAAAARAVGTENLFTGTVRRHRPEQGLSEVDLGGVLVETALLPDAPGSRVALGLRADDVLVCLEPARRTSARNLLAGTVRELLRRGPVVEVRAATPVVFRALVTPASAEELGLAAGGEVYLLVKARSFRRLE